jgi:hypothetical protein
VEVYRELVEVETIRQVEIHERMVCRRNGKADADPIGPWVNRPSPLQDLSTSSLESD